MIRQTFTGRLLHSVRNRGLVAWFISLCLIAFYILLYFTDRLEPFSKALGLPNRWYLYGLLYTIAVAAGGINMFIKYRHNRYQIIRTAVVIFIQVSFAFTLPLVLTFMQKPDYYFSYVWPLKIDYLYPDMLSYHSKVLIIFSLWSVVAAFVIWPLLGVIYGKRFYCSWICGCGGLANTFGEPWRQNSSKSSTSWKVERITINTVLVLAILTTFLAFISALVPQENALFSVGTSFRKYYSIVVASILAGVIGTGLYPILGSRVWCRFFCPMAALLGLIQKFGRYQIRVKRDMCISCGLCSKYCEMGIDVRSYAQSNVNFTRASCVGCGLCAEVCPRGVLRLENRTPKNPQEIASAPLLPEDWKGHSSSIRVRR